MRFVRILVGPFLAASETLSGCFCSAGRTGGGGKGSAAPPLRLPEEPYGGETDPAVAPRGGTHRYAQRQSDQRPQVGVPVRRITH